MSKVLSALTQFSKRPFAEQRMLFQAAMALLRARCLLRFQSLKHLLSAPTEIDGKLSPQQRPQALAVKRALSTIARHLPGGASCLHQALAAHYLFHRHGIAGYLFIGFRLDQNGQAEGHAWVRHDDLIVCGAPVEGFVVASIHRIGR
jgi:hypothetical protein